MHLQIDFDLQMLSPQTSLKLRHVVLFGPKQQRIKQGTRQKQPDSYETSPYAEQASDRNKGFLLRFGVFFTVFLDLRV